MTYETIQFQIPISESLDYTHISDTQDLGEHTPQTKYRILAISEGVHNRLEINKDDIEKMVSRAKAKYAKRPTKNGSFNIPLVLDHSRDMLDKIGTTTELDYNVAPAIDSNKEIHSCIAGVEFWDDTERQQEALKIVRRDPENVFFSVSIRGRFVKSKLPGAMAKMKDLDLVHIAVVQEPADKNARILFNENTTIDEFLKTIKFEDETSIESSDTDIPLNSSTKIQMSMVTEPPTSTDMGSDTSVVGGVAPVATTAGQTVPVTTTSPIAFSYHLSDEETVKRLAKENADLKQEVATLNTKLETVKLALEELDKKVPIISEILALRPEMDKNFMYSLSTEQLGSVKALIVDYSEKLESTTKKPVKAMFADPSTVQTPPKETTKMSPEELVAEFYGDIEE